MASRFKVEKLQISQLFVFQIFNQKNNFQNE